MRVGDYVRSSWGTISKIAEYTPYEDDECFGITLEDGTNTFYKHQWQFDNDYKVSSNIIDLIQVGDYVNGCEVLDKYTYDNCDSHLIVNGNGFNVIMVEDIKSVITKEQFEQTKYRIGD